MDTIIRVMFSSQLQRDKFFNYIDRYEYKTIYNGRPEKSVGWLGDNKGNCRLYLDRRCILNFQVLGNDIQMFGGIIE